MSTTFTSDWGFADGPQPSPLAADNLSTPQNNTQNNTRPTSSQTATRPGSSLRPKSRAGIDSPFDAVPEQYELAASADAATAAAAAMLEEAAMQELLPHYQQDLPHDYEQDGLMASERHISHVALSSSNSSPAEHPTSTSTSSFSFISGSQKFPTNSNIFTD